MSDRERRGDAPGDIILEPNERVLVATRPLFLWEPLVLLLLLLVVGALYATGQANGALAGSLIIAALVLLVWIVVRWIPYGVEGSETALRASVGFWTSDEDLDRLVDGLAALA